MIKKVKNTVPCKYIINDLNGEKTVETFYEHKLQKVNEKFRIEKVILRKDMLNNNSFNGWKNKKCIV